MRTTKTILITRPNHDLITTYLFYWCKYVIDEANRKSFKVLDLKDKKANSANFISYIKKHEPIFVFFNGHGSKDAIAGYDDEILVESNKNDSLLVQKVVYARSCDAADNLGKRCINNGTLCFIGYRKKYILVYTSSKINKPLIDPVAKLFIRPSNLIPISLLKGNTTKDAYRKSQEDMARNLSFMLSTGASQLQKDAAPFLWANKKYQVILGDQNVHI